MGVDGGGSRRRGGFGRDLGELASQWAGIGANGRFELHPDTEPAAIAATQRKVVAEARARLGPLATFAEISDDVILPVWSVERRLKELDEERRHAGDAAAR